MGVMFLVMGGGLGIACLAVFVERLQVILNRTTGRLRMRRRTIFGYEEDVHELTALRGAIVEALREADADPDVRVMILRGAGKCFSSGSSFPHPPPIA